MRYYILSFCFFLMSVASAYCDMNSYIIGSATTVTTSPGSGPIGSGLIGGTDFESASLGSWQNVGQPDPGAYKVITDTGLDDVTDINMKIFTWCSKTPEATLNTYHAISLPTVAGSTWLKYENLDKDYPNRCTLNSNTLSDATYDDYFAEWDYRFGANFLAVFEDISGGAWHSIHTNIDGSDLPVVVQLASGTSSDDGAYWRFQIDKDTSTWGNFTAVVGSVVQGDPHHYANSSTYITGDTTTHVAFYYKCGVDSGGIVKLWIDDVLVLHITGDTGNSGCSTGINFMKSYGVFGPSPEEPQVSYFDNFYIYDTYTE